MYFIEVDKDGRVVNLYMDGVSPHIPNNAIIISDVDGDNLREGFSGWSYVGGSLSFSQESFDSESLIDRKNEALNKIRKNEINLLVDERISVKKAKLDAVSTISELDDFIDKEMKGLL